MVYLWIQNILGCCTHAPVEEGCVLFMARKVLTYVVIVVVAMLCALNYHLFVFPNQFAPSGLNGICTMIQHLTGINVGYMSLLINIPLAILVYFFVSKPLALRSMVYVAVFSLGLVVLDYVDLSSIAYTTENGTSTILGPVVAGIIYGTCYSLMMRVGTFSGGTDFVAVLYHKKHPETNLFWMIFALNSFVAGISFFVYGYQMEPVLLCILYSFTSSMITDKMAKSGRSALRYEIVTQYPEEISREIIQRLHHSATLLPGIGMYKEKPISVLVCIVNKTQAASITAILRNYPHTFANVSRVSQVMGNFKRMDANNHLEKNILDNIDQD